MKTIVAIGGGDLKSNETYLIDEYIVKLCGVKTPKLLFIPTASGEPQDYIDTVAHVYGNQLGCNVSALKLLTAALTDAEIQAKILTSDIIYVGGGNTAKMMAAWQERNVDKYILQAYEKGIILSGMSAGSICWFDIGHSDSYLQETGEYTAVEGLSIIPALHCPHYNQRPQFDDFMKNRKETAIAIDDNCAVVFQNGQYKVIKSVSSSNAYLIKNDNGNIVKSLIDNADFESLDHLLVS